MYSSSLLRYATVALDAREEGAMVGADLGRVSLITGARQIPTMKDCNQIIVRPSEQEV
jgi:hypothetical protein